MSHRWTIENVVRRISDDELDELVEVTTRRVEEAHRLEYGAGAEVVFRQAALAGLAEQIRRLTVIT